VTQMPPPGYEETAARLVSEGVPAEIANNPNDTSGLAGWLLGEYESGRRSWGPPQENRKAA
jgi:hypothetical protein